MLIHSQRIVIIIMTEDKNNKHTHTPHLLQQHV